MVSCGGRSNWLETMKGRAVERRDFLKLGAVFAAMPAAARSAVALDYPTRPVQVIVGQAAASSSDITARLISQFLSQHLGQQFVVEVRPGATGNIATEQVARATPDGYTLLLVNSQNTVNAALFPNLPFDFVRDIAPIAGVFRVPLVMEVLPNFPAQTVPEFIAYAKANPGKINMASAGVGGPQRLRALAVTMPERLDILPGVPAMAEFLPGYEAFGWIGFGAPTKTPTPIVETLNKTINDAIAEPSIKARLLDLGGLVMPPNSPADFGKFIAADTEKWIKVVNFANLKPE